MKRSSLILALSIVGASLSCRSTVECPNHPCGCAPVVHATEPDEPQEAVVSIAVQRPMCINKLSRIDRTPGHQPELIFAMWADGRVKWSHSSLRGGPPYNEMRVDPRVAHEIARFLGFVADSPEGAIAFQVDGFPNTVMRVRDKLMASGHEFAEAGGRIVNQDSFPVVPDFKGAKEAEATWSPKYVEFRRAWRQFRERCDWVVLKGAEATFE